LNSKKKLILNKFNIRQILKEEKTVHPIPKKKLDEKPIIQKCANCSPFQSSVP
jgi:hypothetical protein